MFNWSIIKTALYFGILTSAPVYVLLGLVHFFSKGTICPNFMLASGSALLVAIAAALLGSLFWHKRMTAQVESLIDYCNALALDNTQANLVPPKKLPELDNLTLAIQVMREVLIDYLSLYRRFLEVAPDMFISLTPEGGRILDANQAFFRAVGVLRNEVQGKSLEDFVNLEIPWKKFLSTPHPDQTKGTMETPKGTLKVEISLSWESSPQGKPWILGVILRDVTEKELLHSKLLQKSSALENALEEIKGMEALKDQFLTTLTHELKTPLVALKGFLQMLMRGNIKEEEVPEYYDICWRNLEKLEKQINNLLELARLRHDKEQFTMGPVSLDTLLSNEIKNLKPLAAENQISLHYQVKQPVTINGNSEKLIQLVDNLLLNAIKYNKKGGEVKAFLQKDEKTAVLAVSDTGVGINRTELAHIFNRFYRASDISGSDRLEGLGIGLSLVQEIVRLHNGNVQVESNPGEGTTFTVELDIDNREAV